MFTGLIHGMGTLRSLGSDRVQITCNPDTAATLLADLALGDSVAVDGICLTVATLLADGFVADVSPETRDRAALDQHPDRPVNLEPSLRIGGKLGGHFVTGHVDGIGYLERAVATENAWELAFHTPAAQVARYIVPKGSIAVNGISLTVAACDDMGHHFRVAVIPHTYHATNLHHLHPGSPVNLEADLLGKYVDRLMTYPQNPGNAPLTTAFLTENGYL